MTKTRIDATMEWANSQQRAPKKRITYCSYENNVASDPKTVTI